MNEIRLPEEEYIQVQEDGRTVIYCTMRQKALHVIGMDNLIHKPYTRHGRKFYKPYRNYFSGNDADLDKLVDAGYMGVEERECYGRKDYRIYWFNRKGLDWLGEQLGIYIHDSK